MNVAFISRQICTFPFTYRSLGDLIMSFTEFSGQRTGTVTLCESQLFVLLGENCNLKLKGKEPCFKSLFTIFAHIHLESSHGQPEFSCCTCPGHMSVFSRRFWRKSSGRGVPSLPFTQKWEARGWQVASFSARGVFMFFCPLPTILMFPHFPIGGKWKVLGQKSSLSPRICSLDVLWDKTVLAQHLSQG